MSTPFFRRPVIRASLWTFGGYGAAQVIRLASNLVLTRLLFPEAFGLMALVSVFMTGLGMFSDVGTNAAIIQHERGEDPAFLNTAWTIHIIRGFALWAVACIIAWPVAEFYKEPLLFPLLCVVGSTAAISGFQSMAIATANRKLWLGRITLVNVSNQVATTIVTITLAWIYQSVWALAIGSVAGSVLGTILGHVALPWHRHIARIEQASLRSLFRFGRWVFLTTVVTFVGNQGIRAVQGVLVSAATLGFIAVAATFATSVADMTGKFLGSVAFPKLAMTAREEPEQFRHLLLRFRIRMLLIVQPSLILMSLISVPLVNFLYDDRYKSVGPYLAIMAINSAITLLPMFYHHAFLAMGDSRTPFFVVFISAISQVVTAFVGYYLGGVEGMLMGNGVGAIVYYVTIASATYRAGWFFAKLDLPVIGVIVVGAWASYILHF